MSLVYNVTIWLTGAVEKTRSILSIIFCLSSPDSVGNVFICCLTTIMYNSFYGQNLFYQDSTNDASAKSCGGEEQKQWTTANFKHIFVRSKDRYFKFVIKTNKWFAFFPCNSSLRKWEALPPCLISNLFLFSQNSRSQKDQGEKPIRLSWQNTTPDNGTPEHVEKFEC